MPLTALGKSTNFLFDHTHSSCQVVEHVLISINNKIISFLSVPKKEKFINVPNRTTINFSILTMLITWLSMPYVGMPIIQRSSSVVRQIGRLKFGISISSNIIDLLSASKFLLSSFFQRSIVCLRSGQCSGRCCLGALFFDSFCCMYC